MAMRMTIGVTLSVLALSGESDAGKLVPTRLPPSGLQTGGEVNVTPHRWQRHKYQVDCPCHSVVGIFRGGAR